MASKGRGNGEGSFRRRPDGRWEARISLGYGPARNGARDEHGKPKIVRLTKSIYGDTRAEVAEKLRKAQHTVAQGQPLPDETTAIGPYLDWWLAEIAPERAKPSTVDAYGWVLDHYVRPHVANKKLAKLSSVDVQTMMRSLEKGGLSPATRRKARGILRKAYADAIRLGLANHNPVDAVTAPKVSGSKTSDALTPDEAKLLRAAMAGHRFEALFLLCLGVGLRKGEALALKWDNVDLAGGTVTVAGTLKRVYGKKRGIEGAGLVVDTPKTTASQRTVPLPKVCVDALRQHQIRQAKERLATGPRWHDVGFVFTTPIGSPVDPRNLTDEYHGVTIAAGLGKRRLHALRHTAATFMVANDVDLAIVSKMLGHARYSITADLYVAIRPETLRKGSDAMDRALGS